MLESAAAEHLHFQGVLSDPKQYQQTFLVGYSLVGSTSWHTTQKASAYQCNRLQTAFLENIRKLTDSAER